MRLTMPREKKEKEKKTGYRIRIYNLNSLCYYCSMLILLLFKPLSWGVWLLYDIRGITCSQSINMTLEDVRKFSCTMLGML